jgi:hypothetical protein
LSTGVEKNPIDALPRATSLRAVYPNPFNPALAV